MHSTPRLHVDQPLRLQLRLDRLTSNSLLLRKTLLMELEAGWLGTASDYSVQCTTRYG